MTKRLKHGDFDKCGQDKDNDKDKIEEDKDKDKDKDSGKGFLTSVCRHAVGAVDIVPGRGRG